MVISTETLKSFSSDYKLPRNEAENLRLSSQHYCLIRRQGWLLHPKIASAISELDNPRIADVACGTGIWGFEAANQYPNSIVTGLDISDTQFPPQWTWPKNASLGIVDLTRPVPEEHRAKYDVVHCRLLVQAGPNVDPTTWIRAFESLLKPGGWLQWEEPSNPSFVRVSHVDHSTTPIQFPALSNILRLEYKAGWLREFESWIQKNSGFQEAERIQAPVNPAVAKLENDVIRRVCVDMHGRLMQIADLDDSIRKQIDEEALYNMERINVEGDLSAFNWNVCLARAP